MCIIMCTCVCVCARSSKAKSFANGMSQMACTYVFKCIFVYCACVHVCFYTCLRVHRYVKMHVCAHLCARAYARASTCSENSTMLAMNFEKRCAVASSARAKE